MPERVPGSGPSFGCKRNGRDACTPPVFRERALPLWPAHPPLSFGRSTVPQTSGNLPSLPAQQLDFSLHCNACLLCCAVGSVS